MNEARQTGPAPGQRAGEGERPLSNHEGWGEDFVSKMVGISPRTDGALGQR